jgi:hypothetical protein
MHEYLGEILYIKPNYVVSVPEFDTPKNWFSASRVENAKNLRSNLKYGKLSEKAQKNIKSAVNWLVVSAKDKKVYNKSSGKYHNFKINLITLTLPDTDKPISEKDFKTKLMHVYLVYMKKYYNLKNYVWKLELQNNGKIHLHLTTDSYIDKDILRHYWNALLEKNNYLEEFKQKFKHNNPNSTDVHAVWKVKNLGAYLAKYLSKNEQSSECIMGRIWGCNYELSASNKCIIGIDRDEVHEELRTLNDSRIERKIISYFDELKQKTYTSAIVYFIQAHQWKEIIKGKIKECYDCHRFDIRNGTGHLRNLVYN